jgi:hypothetical protein
VGESLAHWLLSPVEAGDRQQSPATAEDIEGASRGGLTVKGFHP